MKLRNYKTVRERRLILETELKLKLPHIGSYSLDESIASARNCENMIGVAQVPLGIAGPIKISNINPPAGGQISKSYYLPLATTEGALVASVNRGCKAISVCGGVTVNSHRIGATRGPVFKTKNLSHNHEVYLFLDDNFIKMQKIAASTSSHLTLKKYQTTGVGRYRYIRFYFHTQDAMGMNMATIATEKISAFIEEKTSAKLLSVTGNFCTDKKVSWQNFINNRGFKAWAEVELTPFVLKNILKTDALSMHEVWTAKCMLGSIVSGSIGFNAQAANVIGAIFLSTGQDLGHIGEGSMAVTTTEIIKSKEDALLVSVYLPDLMVGTVGGGTGLATQKESLEIMGIQGGKDGENAQTLAEIIAGAVLAGEISLLASVEEGSLGQDHDRLARGRK